jgi:hypothetical protein
MMVTFNEFNKLVDLQKYMELERRYAWLFSSEKQNMIINHD